VTASTTPPSFEQAGLELERRGPITILTLNRPERLNALSQDVIRGLNAVVAQLAVDLSQRVLIITGAGRGFCSGTDLKDQATAGPWVEGVGEVQARYALQEAVGRVTFGLRHIPQPVIAVVNGVAAGGGLSLALAADIRIAEPAARFSAAFVKLGVSGGDLGSSWLVPQALRFDHAAELLYTGRMVESQEAERIGLVTHLVDEGQGMAAALALAEEMVQLAPFTTRMTKSLLNLAQEGLTMAQMLEYENRTQILMTQTEDFAEGVDAFAQRRPASFTDH
jgi:enoyl-CoA hydratase